MKNLHSEEEPCHVCEHLGEKECRYTSHKKYRNQKANESFKVDIVSHSPHRSDTSYLNNFKQQKIKFQFPSLIPPFSGYFIGLKNSEQNNNFERTLIEKVLEDRVDETKVQYHAAYQSQTQSSFKDVKTQEKSRMESKRPMGFLRHHKSSQPKQSIQNSLAEQNEVGFSMIEKGQPAFQQKKIIQKLIYENHQSNFAQKNKLQPKGNKYHFDYSIKQQSELAKDEKAKSQIKSNESSFHVEDYKFNTQTAEFLISRVKDKEKNSSYMGNIFKDASRVAQIEKNEQLENKDVKNSAYSPQLHQQTNPVIANLSQEKKQPKQDEQLMNRNNYSPDNFKQKEKIVNHMAVPTSRHNFAQSIVKHAPKIFKQQFSTHYDFPESRIKQEIPVRIQPNESIQTKRSNFDSISMWQKLFYPIYPVYEVVYELVQVIPDSLKRDQVGSFRKVPISSPLK